MITFSIQQRFANMVETLYAIFEHSRDSINSTLLGVEASEYDAIQVVAKLRRENDPNLFDFYFERYVKAD